MVVVQDSRLTVATAAQAGARARQPTYHRLNLTSNEAELVGELLNGAYDVELLWQSAAELLQASCITAGLCSRQAAGDESAPGQGISSIRHAQRQKRVTSWTFFQSATDMVPAAARRKDGCMLGVRVNESTRPARALYCRFGTLRPFRLSHCAYRNARQCCPDGECSHGGCPGAPVMWTA